MKYTKEQRLEIGRKIYEGELSRADAAAEYGVGEDTARACMRLYRDEHHLPGKPVKRSGMRICAQSSGAPLPPAGLEDYEAMRKEELIRELVRARITEARLKKATR